MKQFDRKFGEDRVAALPPTPGVYLFKDERGRVLYVGKAKNLRRRLSSYRNASRRKAHRKMRALVREASGLEVRVQTSEVDARVLENELIRSLEPPYNVEGTFSFLYPAIGLQREASRTLLCFTTSIDAWNEFRFTWYGHFRSRRRAKQAFGGLVDLLGLIGHLERRSTLGPAPRLRGSRLVGIRRLGSELVTSIAGYLAGESTRGLEVLTLGLVEKPLARSEASDVQSTIELLDAFYRSDLAPLRAALRKAGRSDTLVGQAERDTLFIRSG